MLSTLLVGMAVIARPGAGALAVLAVMGLWSILTGIFFVLGSFKVKSMGAKLGQLKEQRAL